MTADAAVIDAQKRAAGEAAATLARSGMRLGLGTGSTIYFTIEALGRMHQQGALTDIVTVATSERTAAQARGLGLPVRDLSEVLTLDLTIDGADEVDPSLRLVKGLGGALLREKIVASSSASMAVVVDAGKLVARLGTRAPLPVEVDPFGWRATHEKISRLGCAPHLRETAEGQPYRTDGGHYILDCHFEHGIDEPDDLERVLNMIPGVIDSGLFIGIAHRIIVGGEAGVREMVAGGALRPFSAG